MTIVAARTSRIPPPQGEWVTSKCSGFSSGTTIRSILFSPSYGSSFPFFFPGPLQAAPRVQSPTERVFPPSVQGSRAFELYKKGRRFFLFPLLLDRRFFRRVLTHHLSPPRRRKGRYSVLSLLAWTSVRRPLQIFFSELKPFLVFRFSRFGRVEDTPPHTTKRKLPSLLPSTQCARG